MCETVQAIARPLTLFSKVHWGTDLGSLIIYSTSSPLPLVIVVFFSDGQNRELLNC